MKVSQTAVSPATPRLRYNPFLTQFGDEPDAGNRARPGGAADRQCRQPARAGQVQDPRSEQPCGDERGAARDELEDGLVLGRKLDWQVTGTLTLENAINVGSCSPPQIDIVDPVGNQAAVPNEIAVGINCR